MRRARVLPSVLQVSLLVSVTIGSCTMLVRHPTLLIVAVVLVAISPRSVLSRPAPEEAVPSKDELKQASLEEAVAKFEVGPSKKPTKRSQATASGSQSVFAAPASTAESVSLSPQIPDPDKKGLAIQGLLLNILHPKPIVDTIREEDKYGNTGDKFAALGRGVVAGAEGVSQVLLKVLDFPFDAFKKVSRSATEALNNLGSKIIGL